MQEKGNLLVLDIADIIIYLSWDSLEDRVSEARLVNHFSMVPVHHNYLDTIFRVRELLAIDLREQKAFPDQRFLAPVYQNAQKKNHFNKNLENKAEKNNNSVGGGCRANSY